MLITILRPDVLLRGRSGPLGQVLPSQKDIRTDSACVLSAYYLLVKLCQVRRRGLATKIEE